MKDIGQVRMGLGKIGAIPSSKPPQTPRYPGRLVYAERADLGRFEEPAGVLSEEDRAPTDTRDLETLFRELDTAVVENGFDALAWYHPFHLSGDEWGIYVPVTSLHYCAERWFSARIRQSRRLPLGFDAL